MAINKKFKKNLKQKADAEKISKVVSSQMDEIADDETPYLSQDSDGSLSVVGDPKKVGAELVRQDMKVRFILPFTDFDMDDFDSESISNVTDYTFNVTTIASQEPLSPLSRASLADTAVRFLSMFFVDQIDDEGNHTGQIIFNPEIDSSKVGRSFYRDYEMVGACKDFVGGLLGVDEELIPYLHDFDLLMQVYTLINENRELLNSAYRTAK